VTHTSSTAAVNPPQNVTVLGAGSWGTALACLLCEQGHQVTLWGRDPASVQTMRDRQENARYLPGVKLPSSLLVTSTLADLARSTTVFVVALPSATVRETLKKISDDFNGVVVCASKGLEKVTALTMDQVILSAWNSSQPVLLSGPTFATEIAQGRPAAAVVASHNELSREVAQRLFTCGRFRVYGSDDVIGVALGGALKNVIALAAGCSDGLGFGNNARAALITRGLAEIGRLAAHLGGNPLTLAGLAGLGDLVLTCTGELSRNRTVGLALGRGEPLGKIAARLGQVAEGVETAQTAAELSARLGLDLPIISVVAAVLSGTHTAAEAVSRLLAREIGSEFHVHKTPV
jgi:glycerol-3-phosphate dehydrogenase (NAD(P)+)